MPTFSHIQLQRTWFSEIDFFVGNKFFYWFSKEFQRLSPLSYGIFFITKITFSMCKMDIFPEY